MNTIITMTTTQKIIIAAIFLFTVIGFLDSTYLTWAHYAGAALECTIWDGCDEVARSEYSVLFWDIPIALLGMIYYAGVIFLMLIYAVEKSRTALRLALMLVFTGFLFSAYFVYLQLFVIKAICFYCMVSVADTAALFVLLAVLNLRKCNPSTTTL